MAQYKVPQDVEADDKLLGPFSFRQFVYLLIASGLIALAVGLFQLFPILAIIPVPFILFLGALALPLRKDQPMETYLAALLSFYLKPRTKRWTPGQRESTIMITAPKKTDDVPRTRNISGEEATHRLSFLADIVDTEGYAIKGDTMRRVSDEIVEEAKMTNDIFETPHFDNLENTINKDENDHHARVLKEMRDALDKLESTNYASQTIVMPEPLAKTQTESTSGVGAVETKAPAEPTVEVKASDNDNTDAVNRTGQIVAKPSIIELANNSDYSVATISKEAKRIKERDEGEVFISLH